MRINVEKPSFVYDKPVLFLGKEYKDSLSFVEALLDDWDIGAMALKGGFFESFSEEYILNYSSKMPLDFHNLTENAWRNDAFSNLDALFAALLYLIEPQFKELPFPDPETRKVSFLPALTCRRMLERGTIKKWFLAMETCDPLWDEPYNKDFVLLSYLVCLLRLGMLNAYLVEDVYRSYRKRLAEKISNYEEMNQLLQKIAEHLFDKNIYVYDGRTFEKPKEFMGYLKYDFGIWDHDKWKAFIKVLLEERAARLTFMDWLYNIGEHELRNSLAGWKKEHLKALEDIKMEEVDMVFSFDAYMKWGTKQEHDHIIDELEKQLKVDYGKYKMEEKIEAVEALYKAYYELTSILFGVSEKITVKWEDLAIYRQLQELKKWWEAEQKRLNDAYESDKKFLESIKERKIVESEVQLRSKNISINGSREWKSELIVLLLAAPEKETYQNCLNDLKEYFKRYDTVKYTEDDYPLEDELNAMYQYILKDMFRECEDDKAIEGYVKLIGEKCDLYKKRHRYRSFELKKDIISLIKIRVGFSVSELSALKEEPYEMSNGIYYKRHGDYDKFYKTDVYKNYSKILSDVRRLEKEYKYYWQKQVDAKNAIERCFDQECITKSLEEIRSEVAKRCKEFKDATLECEKTHVKLEKVRGDEKKAREGFRKLKREYEDEMEKIQDAKKKKERKRQILKTKIKKCALVGGITFLSILVLFLSVCAGWGMYHSYIPWETHNNVLDVELSGTSDKELALYAKRLTNNASEDGEFVIPAEASVIGDLGIGNFRNVDEDMLPSIKKLSFENNICETTEDFNISDCAFIEEIDFGTINCLRGNFSNTGLRHLESDTISSIYGTVPYGSVFSGTDTTGGAFSNNDKLLSVKLGGIEELEHYTFSSCDNLKKVNMANVKVLGDYAFENCYSLADVYMPAAEDFNYFVFMNCTSLESVELPGAREMCLSSFYGCTNLKEVYLPNVETIYFNKALTSGRIYIGDSVQNVSFQVVPTKMENGEWENIYEKFDIEIVLDANGEYLPEVMEVFKEVSSNSEVYGEIDIAYEDFDAR